jgi:hypothetical protein
VMKVAQQRLVLGIAALVSSMRLAHLRHNSRLYRAVRELHQNGSLPRRGNRPEALGARNREVGESFVGAVNLAVMVSENFRHFGRAVTAAASISWATLRRSAARRLGSLPAPPGR